MLVDTYHKNELVMSFLHREIEKSPCSLKIELPFLHPVEAELKVIAAHPLLHKIMLCPMQW